MCAHRQRLRRTGNACVCTALGKAQNCEQGEGPSRAHVRHVRVCEFVFARELPYSC